MSVIPGSKKSVQLENLYISKIVDLGILSVKQESKQAQRTTSKKASCKGDNSWYLVYKRSWYPADIRLIFLISGCWIRSKHGFFLHFLKFFTLWPLSTDIWIIFSYIQLIFNSNSVNFVLISVYYTSGWYPWYPDIRSVNLGEMFPIGLFRKTTNRYFLTSKPADWEVMSDQTAVCANPEYPFFPAGTYRRIGNPATSCQSSHLRVLNLYAKYSSSSLLLYGHCRWHVTRFSVESKWPKLIWVTRRASPIVMMLATGTENTWSLEHNSYLKPEIRMRRLAGLFSQRGFNLIRSQRKAAVPGTTCLGKRHTIASRARPTETHTAPRWRRQNLRPLRGSGYFSTSLQQHSSSHTCWLF